MTIQPHTMPALTDSKNLIRLFCVLTLLVLFIASTFSSLHAQAIIPIHTKLTPTLIDGGSIGRYRISVDRTRVVYLADQEIDNVFELYSVATNGASPVKLSGTMAAGGTVASFVISPDGQSVVYTANPDGGTRIDIFSVSITGGMPVKLTQTLPDDSIAVLLVNIVAVSPDSQYVVYSLEKRGTFKSYALISVPVHGGEQVTLTPTLVTGGSISSYRFSLTGSHVLYVADQEVDERYCVYAVPITGGAAVALSGNLNIGESVTSLMVTKRNEQIVYAVNSSPTATSLFSVPLTGGTPALLSNLAESALPVIWLSPDGSKLLYATQTGNFPNTTYKLYVISPTGGIATLLSSTSETEGTFSRIISVDVISNNQQVVFSIFASLGTYIYITPISGGTKNKLAGPFGGTGFPNNSQLTKFSEGMVYSDVDMRTTPYTYKLSYVALPQGQPQAIGSAVAPFQAFTLTADDNYIIYHTAGTFENYILPVSGGESVKLNISLAPGDYTEPFDQFTPFTLNNQSCLVYAVTQPRGDRKIRHSLYVSCVAAPSIPMPNHVYLPWTAK